MADVLIRDVPDDVLAAIDADASRQHLSRSAYLRRLLERSAPTCGGSLNLSPDAGEWAG